MIGDTPGSESASALSPLRHPIFRAVWLASLAASFGGMIQMVGASWLMTSIAGSPQMVALVQASVTLPIMLLALLAGAAADNFDRRTMMLGSQLFMLLVSIALAACAFLDLITPWLLLLLTFLLGCGAAFYGPAWQASVRELVPREALPGAVALNSMGFNIARSLGPAIGGAIVAAAGAAAAFAVNALSYFALLAVLGRWRPNRAKKKLPREKLGVAMIAGLRYAALSPVISVVLGRSLVFGLGASAVSSLLPIVARDVVSGGPMTFGLMLGAFGVGAVAGALASTRLRSLASPETIVRSSCLAAAAAAAIVGLSSNLILTLALLVVAGAAWVLALSTFNVTVQLSSPRWVVARALSLYQMAAFGGMALGSWLWGSTAAHSGIPPAFLAAAGVLVACALLGFTIPLKPMAGDLDLDPLREWMPPAPAIEVEPRTGPVVVTIEFKISEEDIPEFLAAMLERRRIRRRDGARRWTLLRDVGNPQTWIERFHLANWTEYIRHNNRLTQSDLLPTGRARELHLGAEPPLVRRMIERQPGEATGDGAPAETLTEPLTDPRRFG